MAPEVKSRTETRRSYRSPRRTEQARATRQAIRDAAARLFLEHGYGGTRITAIAAAADVAPETVYAAFKNKKALLKEVIDVAIAGDDEPVAVVDRPWLDDVRAEPDPVVRTRMLSDDGFARAVRVAPILEVLRSAAASDPDLTALWDEIQAARRAQIELYVEIIGTHDPDAAGTKEYADLVWVISGPEIVSALVGDQNWSVARFITVMGDLVEAFGTLPPPSP